MATLAWPPPPIFLAPDCKIMLLVNKNRNLLKWILLFCPWQACDRVPNPCRESFFFKRSTFQQGVDSEEPLRQLVTSVYLTAAYVSAKRSSLPVTLLAWSRDAPIQMRVSCIGPILSLCPCVHRHKTLYSKTTVTALLSWGLEDIQDKQRWLR